MLFFGKKAFYYISDCLTDIVYLAKPSSIAPTIIMSIAIAVIPFLFSLDYSRKDTVRGFLIPSKEKIKSFTNETITIDTLLMKKENNIDKSQTLAAMIIHQNSTDRF